MECIGLDVSARMGLWEFASHIRAITVMGTMVRLVALMAPTGQAVLDHMALRLFGGHIRGNNRGSGKQGAAT
jgi:hypothetical protein